MSKISAEQLLATLRAHLKSQPITLSELAQRCDLSESTIKRLLNRPHIALDQLMLLCEQLDISLKTLIELNEQTPEDITQAMSAKQVASIVKNPGYLSVYVAILAGKRTFAEIQQQFDLNTPSTYLYLRHLDNLGYVTFTDPDIALVYPLSAELTNITPEFESQLLQQTFANLQSHVKNQHPSSPSQQQNIQSYLIATPEQYQAYKDDFQTLIEKHAKVILKNVQHPQPNQQLYTLFHATWLSMDQPLFPVENLVDAI